MLCKDNAAQYIDDEIIWDLTDYIQEYAPDYYAFLQTNPAYDKAMKDDRVVTIHLDSSVRMAVGMIHTKDQLFVRTGWKSADLKFRRLFLSLRM